MSSTDDRIVRMQFENRSFMKGAADTQKSLADVNKAVDSAGKGKGLLDLSSQMTNVGVTASKMAIVTTTALATIANKVVNTGLNMAKALTLDPLKQGFEEYGNLLTKQNVIMNATGKSAQVVKGYLNQLNHYSDRTIYSFGDMTDSITKFVNAGVPLPQAVTSIRGIANAAAYSGATTQEASRGMYAFSQSMQTGYIMLQDWMQVENANMGTQEFKNTLLEAGVAAGTLTKRGKEYITAAGHAVTSTKGWRDGLQDQWATTEVLNTALGKYADTSTELGRKAYDAATKVRTFSAFMDTLKESIGSGWSGIFTALIGNLNQATNFWTGLSNAIGNTVKSFFNFFTVSLRVWRKMGGFEKTMQGFKNILAPFAALLKAIGDAWAVAFPSSDKGAGKALYGLSYAFELLTRPLAWLAKGIPVITPLLVVLFTAIHDGGAAIGGVLKYIWDFVSGAQALASVDAPSTGGFLGFVQSIVRALDAAIDKAGQLIDKAGGLGGVFHNISMPSLPSLPSVDTSSATSGASAATSAAQKTASGMASAMQMLQSIAAKMGATFSWLWDQAVGFFQKADPEDFVRAFNSAIFATMGIEVIRFFHNIGSAFKAFADIGDGVGDVLEGAGSALKSFQTAAQAKLILAIAVAIVALAASLWLLSKIPIKQLAPALAAMGVLMYMMTASMKAFGGVLKKTDGLIKGVNMVALAASVMLLALAMLAFAAAMLVMNKVEWQSIGKGLITMGAAFQAMKVLGDMAAGSYKNMLGAAVAISAISVSMIILAGALLLFKLVDWGSMGKAGAVLGGLTLAVGALALIPYQGIAKVGVALLTASVGMLAIANALLIFQLVKWESIGKAAVVLGLLTISLAVLMAVGGPASVAAMLGLAGAMVLLALACIMFNHVDWQSIGKATVVLTVLLAALAVGAVIMTAFLYAIAPVSPVLIILAAGFALLGIGLLAFSVAMTVAMGLAAAGTAAFAALATGAAVAIGVFLQTLALQAPIMRKSVLAILQELIRTVVEAIPMIIQGFKDVFKAIMKEMGSNDKKKSFGEVAQEWFDKLIEFARKNIPKVQRLFVDMVLSLLQALNRRIDDFAQAGTDFIVGLIKGFGSRQQQIIAAAIDVVIKFAEGLRKNIKKLTDAGIDLIAGFLHDLADSIRSGSSKIGSGITDVIGALKDVGVNMVKGLGQGITDNFDEVLGPLGDLMNKAVSLAKKIPLINSPSKVFIEIGKFMAQGLGKGIQDHASAAILQVARMMTGAIAMADDMMSKYIQKSDQQALAARGRAMGIARAAALAQKSANRTKKDKGDDKAANQLSKQAKQADKIADKEERESKALRAADARKKKWENADAAERAEIKSNQAQSQLNAAKAAERDAEAARVQANALREQAKKAGTPEERKKLLKAAEAARKQAKEAAERANKLTKGARGNAADAMVWQKKAGEQAAEAFEEQFKAEAKADADAAAFEKLSDTEKAEKRREQAEALQKKADANLAKAKKLAYTDLEKANQVAQLALAQAEEARNLLDEANGYGTGGGTGQVVDLKPTDSAVDSYNNYADLYDSAYAAAAAGQKIEFNQYNQSPESLSDADIYRNTNNQLTFAEEKLTSTP